MEQYIKKSTVVAEIEKLVDKGKYHEEYDCAYRDGNNSALYALKGKIDTLEVKGVDLGKQAECIANGIMIAVQSAKLHTNVYNQNRRDYDHSHLMQAARRGIELGIKIAQKGE